jgi:hypothetical protein
MPAYTHPETTTAPPIAPESDETTAYMARLETYLSELAPPERLPALKSLRTWWITELDRWTFRMDTDTASPGDLKIRAVDFSLTVAALGKRIAQEEV